ncbi:MAG: alpha/beta fold hydrolase [Polaromonas sp.]|nr:alpha/beta fold hydrolase [Polaromonas sp.]
MHARNILILPGWQNSGPDHWQSRWEAAHGYNRVEQHSWTHPLRGDWSARLEEVLLGCDEPAVLVAHSLGCILTAAWAGHSRNTRRVKAALLVAPPDLAREDIRELLPSWSPLPTDPLPFPTVLMASDNDPYCAAARAREIAAAWGATFVDAGARGHLNSESGLGDWPEAHEELLRLSRLPAPGP